MKLSRIIQNALAEHPSAVHALSGPITLEHLINSARSLCPKQNKTIAQTLRQNLPQDLLASDHALSNSLQKLTNGAVVVCAGQQPSLCGGTFLSLYKAATAVVLSTHLNDHGINAIPLFWNASEDHDFTEANQLYLPPNKQETETQLCALESRYNEQSLSRTFITKDDHNYIKTLVARYHQDEKYIPEIDQAFGTWATRLMLLFTKNTGLLVCEPEWFSDQLIPFRQQLTSKLPELIKSLVSQTNNLSQNGYPTPIKFDPTQESMLFSAIGDQRTKLKKTTSGHFAIGDARWNLNELQDQLCKHPSEFTSSAISRPLAQQFLFPVVTQISGPTESAYLAQLRELYPLMDVSNPIIWPRATCLILREEEQQLSTFLNIPVSGLLKEELPHRIQLSENDNELIDQIDKSLRASLTALDKHKHKDSRTEFIRFRTDVYSQWRDVRKRTIKIQKQELKPKSKSLHRLKQLVQPRGISQERAFGPFSFGLPVNADLFHLLCERIDPFQFQRQLIQL